MHQLIIIIKIINIIRSSSSSRILLLASFSHQRQLVFFYWSLNVSKSPQISETLVRIGVELNYAVVEIVSAGPSISNYSISFTKPFEIVPSTLITIDETVTFMFHCI